MHGEVSGLVESWPQFLTVALLVMVRLSGLMVFAPVLSSVAIAPRIKAGLVIAMTLLLAPGVAAVPGARAALDARAILGELSVGLVFGLTLTILTESLEFAGTLLGMEFSFSLVNLLDPNTRVETQVMGQILSWLGVLTILGSGLHLTLIAAVVRSFCAVPVGQAVMQAKTCAALAGMAGGIFLAGVQLAAPVMAAAMAVEMTVALVARLSPQLPAMVVGIPLKTMVSYAVLVGSLAVWPGWIERHFSALLDTASRLIVRS